MASQITSLTIVYSTVHPGADQRKHQSSASLAFVRGIHRWPVTSPQKWPVTRKFSIWWRHHVLDQLVIIRCVNWTNGYCNLKYHYARPQRDQFTQQTCFLQNHEKRNHLLKIESTKLRPLQCFHGFQGHHTLSCLPNGNEMATRVSSPIS